jgi:single-stranded-DNA-specific exonuclease
MIDTELREKRWVAKTVNDAELVNSLASQLNINKTLASLLVHREIKTFEEAKRFFRPSLNDLHDPFLMKDMDKAVERIEQAIINKEKILVYGDYDVDGTTAVALVYSFLKKHYDDIDFYLPDRYKEGYGISLKGIEYAKEINVKLIIALDCGIKSNDKVDLATTYGIDFIICDHHRPGDIIPKAVAVLDPKRQDDTYPFDELSGCGIGFKLVSAYAKKHNIPFSELEQYLDLVAVSSAADIVPITGENRTLVHFGLKRINYHPRHGFKAILEMEKVPVFEDKLPEGAVIRHYNLSVNELVFIIGPRINAAGRIHDARHAVELLISGNVSDAVLNSKRIQVHNDERKNLDLRITQEALAQVQNDPEFSKKKSTILFNSDWHKGVIGIVASRLTDRYYRPTIILTESNGMATGSARSVKDFDIYNAIESCRDLLEEFGGHMYAAGLTMKIENLELFKLRFEEVVSSTITEASLVQEVEIDATLQLDEISPGFFNILKQFAPFGPGNMNPVFRSVNVRDTGLSRIVGNNHLKLNISEDENKRFGGIEGIGFGMGDYYSFISRRVPFQICYSLEENHFNGRTSIQMNAKDIRVNG